MIYIFCFLFVSTFAGLLFWVRPRTLSVFVVSVILATFAALRDAGVSADLTVYEDWYFNRITDSGFLPRPSVFEGLYFLLSDLFLEIGSPFRVFVWGAAFFAIALKVWVLLKYSKVAEAFVFALLAYFFSFYLLHEFTQIRVGMAMAVLFFAFQFLVNGRRVQFICFVLLATGFHSSALAALLLLLPYRGRIGNVIHVLLVLAAFVFIFLATLGFSAGVSAIQGVAHLDPRLDFYLSNFNGGGQETANPFPVMGGVALLLVLSLSDLCLKDDEQQFSCEVREDDAIRLICRSILIGLCFLDSMWMVQTIALRFYEFFTAFMPILVGIVFSRREFFLQKGLALIWVFGAAYTSIFNGDGLVRPYVWLF